MQVGIPQFVMADSVAKAAHGVLGFANIICPK